MTWTNSQHDDALKKAGDGKKLSNHQEQKLREAGKQAGARGDNARRTMDEYDRRKR